MCIRTRPQPRSAASSNSAGSRAAADVVDRDRAGVERRARRPRPRRCRPRSGSVGPLGEPVDRRDQPLGLLVRRAPAGRCAPRRRRRRACRSPPRPARARPRSPARGCRCAHPRTSSPSVTLTIPTPSGRSSSRVRSASRQVGPWPTVAARPTAYGYRSARHGPALRLHRSRRHPARPLRLALPRRRGQLLDAAGARARGLPPRRGRGRDQVRPPRAPGAGGRAADRPDRLHLRGRLRGDDRRRGHGPDRRLPSPTRAGRSTRRSSTAASRSCCSSPSPRRSSTTPPGTPSASTPTSSAARSTSPRRTRSSSARATAACA